MLKCVNHGYACSECTCWWPPLFVWLLLCVCKCWLSVFHAHASVPGSVSLFATGTLWQWFHPLWGANHAYRVTKSVTLIPEWCIGCSWEMWYLYDLFSNSNLQLLKTVSLLNKSAFLLIFAFQSYLEIVRWNQGTCIVITMSHLPCGIQL